MKTFKLYRINGESYDNRVFKSEEMAIKEKDYINAEFIEFNKLGIKQIPLLIVKEYSYKKQKLKDLFTY